MTRTLRPTSLWLDEDDHFENHGAAILMLVRDGTARNWQDICHLLRFDRDRREYHSGHHGLRRTLERLIDAGLLTSAVSYQGPYEVTEHALSTLDALGISLTQAANLLDINGLAIRPVFGSPTRLEKAAHVFVVMPFLPELNPVYKGSLKGACQRMRLSIERADDIFSSGELVQDIWNGIVNCFAVVADCSGRNPNVFYELDIAHTLGKPVILITQDNVPVDIEPFRYIRYENSLAGRRSLSRIMFKTLTELTKHRSAAVRRRRNNKKASQISNADLRQVGV
jgi:hypothetical protein